MSKLIIEYKDDVQELVNKSKPFKVVHDIMGQPSTVRRFSNYDAARTIYLNLRSKQYESDDADQVGQRVALYNDGELEMESTVNWPEDDWD